MGPLSLGQDQAAGLNLSYGGSRCVSDSQGLSVPTAALPSGGPALLSKGHPDDGGASLALPLAWAPAQPQILESSPRMAPTLPSSLRRAMAPIGSAPALPLSLVCQPPTLVHSPRLCLPSLGPLSLTQFPSIF